ncbi:hypothetical protein K461DRAFT_272114 [Myriangium duriaei CBS 260.36]|uniref:Major facilitator superfamily (MFS) profile domain-containing protein n=1 Tax=Myriangium duriaei CBS 260.36 TaxID=1168546 RepID=A0A9P4IT97_9PEZI|nr:hypothetical protein K461DRAFT_272114 [Myriangium duriaei CBS 260.36]
MIAESIPVGGDISYDDISTACGLNVDNVRRILRFAMTNHFFVEARPNHVSHTSASRLLVEDKQFRCSEDPTLSGWGLANNAKAPFFQELEERHPSRFQNVKTAMEAWDSWVPNSPLNENYSWSSVKKMVDIGGGRGLVSQSIASHDPTPRFVVQDLPGVVADASAALPAEFSERITFMAHNMFEEQPVKDADVYFFRSVFHDWPDASCVQILRALIPALKPGARILINDACMPPDGALNPRANRSKRRWDLSMMLLFNARDRENGDWASLFEKADPRFKFLGVRTPDVNVEGIPRAWLLSIIEALSENVMSGREYHQDGSQLSVSFIKGLNYPAWNWLNGEDTGSIGAITEMPHFQSTFGQLSPFMSGLTISIIMLAGAFPSIYAGQLGDKFGRLRIIMAGIMLFVLGVILQGSAFQLPMFIVGRVVGGIGMGMWMPTAGVYVTEIAPSARRGMLMGTLQLAVQAGVCCGYFTAYGTVRVDSSMSWRMIYIIQATVGLVMVGLCFGIPESPRWELLKGRPERARRLLDRLDFSRTEAEKDLFSVVRRESPQPDAIQGLIMIFRRPYRRRTALAFVMLGTIQLSGIDAVVYYAPVLFAQAGLSRTTASFLASGLSAILMFLVVIPALLFIDRLNRRSVTFVGGLLLVGCMLTIGTLYAANAVRPDGPGRFIVIALVFLFGVSYCATWGVVGKIYASEIQPTATRSAANCVATGLNFLANWLVAMITPLLLARSSFSAYFLLGGICALMVLGLWFYMPETKGQSLEAIEEAFKTPFQTRPTAVKIPWQIIKRGLGFGHREERARSGRGGRNKRGTIEPST